MESLLVPFTSKPFVLCLFKSLSEDQIELLKQHGKVIQFGPVFMNRSVHSFSFDYFIIDLREEDHRFYYQRHVMRYHEQFHIVLFRYSFETNQGILFHNELVDFPNYQISKEEFDVLLLETPLPSPSCFMSLIRFCMK